MFKTINTLKNRIIISVILLTLIIGTLFTVNYYNQFSAEGNKYLGKSIKISDNVNVSSTIDIPADAVIKKAVNKSGKTNGVIFELKDGSTIRLMNPVTRHANPSLNYPTGYVRKTIYKGIDPRTGIKIYQNLDINGNITTNNNLNHFNIKPN